MGNKHTEERKEKRRKLIVKGLPRGISTQAYLRHLGHSNQWNKAHRAQCNIAWKCYITKLVAEAGGSSRHLRAEAIRKRREARLRRIREARQAITV